MRTELLVISAPVPAVVGKAAKKSPLPGITRSPERTDIEIHKIDAIEVAAKLGSSKVYNMAVLGGFLKLRPIVSMENVEKGLAKSIPARYGSLIPLNKAAIEEGMNAVE